MLAYNITTKVNNSIVNEWLLWQKQFNIPEIMSTGLFYEYRFFKLHDHDEMEGETFVLQLFAKKREEYDKYIRDYSIIFREKAFEKWGNLFISFQTLLQSVH